MCSIIRHLGSGFFADVYLLQLKMKNEFALKVVKTERLGGSLGIYDEAKLMLRLCHPHLVRCCDAFLSGSHLYLITELCSHGTLEQFLDSREGLVSERKVLLWLGQMTDVLRYLHADRIIHRDLKPANIYLAEGFDIKVGDLGIAKELDFTAQRTKAFMGTIRYMSPEAQRGCGYSYKTDIWSLGCCVHEMMTLKKTFPGNMQAVRAAVECAKIPPMSRKYSSGLKELVYKMFDVNETTRPDALEIFFYLSVDKLFQISGPKIENPFSKLQGQRFEPAPQSVIAVSQFDHTAIIEAVCRFEIKQASIKEIIHIKPDNNSSPSSDAKLSHSFDSSISVSEDLTDSLLSHDSTLDSHHLPQSSRELQISRTLTLPSSETHWSEDEDTFTHLHRTTKSERKNKNGSQQISNSKNIESSHSSVLSHSSSIKEDSQRQKSLWEKNLTHNSQAEASLLISHEGFNGSYHQYIDTLAKESVQWLRSKFQDCLTEEIDDDPFSEAELDLVTLYTRAQKVKYKNPRKRSGTKENLFSDVSKDTIEAALNVVRLVDNNNEDMLEMMLLKILGNRNYVLHAATIKVLAHREKQ